MHASKLQSWLSERSGRFESSGIRKMFALASRLKDPINLSIGQPDFPVPDVVKAAMKDAIDQDRNGYTSTEGIAPLRTRIKQKLDEELGPNDRQVVVCSGTSGALTLAVLSLVNPGDEVIYFDPYFVAYPAIVELAGGVSVPISNYPDFRIRADLIEQAITSRTKLIILNGPGNPTGICHSDEDLQAVADLARRHNICLLSDEVYSKFSYDGPHRSPAKDHPDTLVIDGYSKTVAMTGLRVGFIHGPAVLVDTIAKLQQFTFVCAPAPAQWGAVEAVGLTMHDEIERYRAKRDYVLSELRNDYEIQHPGGAFYIFPRLPWGTGEEFLKAAIDNELLVIPGTVFSKSDTHFRISYAVDDRTLERGVEVLKRIARRA